MITNILEYLEATVVAVPDKIAFSDGTDSLTHRQLYDAARSGGSRLISLGCGREPVMVIMDKHPFEVAAFLSVIYAGGFYVPVDAEMPPLRMQSMVFLPMTFFGVSRLIRGSCAVLELMVSMETRRPGRMAPPM